MLSVNDQFRDGSTYRAAVVGPSRDTGAGLSERRLDWRVVVVHAVTFREARAVLSGAGPLAAIVALQGRLDGPRIAALAVGVAVLSVVAATVRWWRFSYAIDGERLLVRQGLLSRSERAVPLDRVRGVDVEAAPLHRLFRLAVVHVDAAAGAAGGDEAILDAVSVADVHRLRALLLAEHRSANAVPGTDHAIVSFPAEHDTAVEVYARLDPRWLLYAPLVGSYLAVPLALGGTLLRDVNGLPLPEGLRRLLDLPDNPGVARLAGTAAVVVVLVALGALVAGAVSNWGFVLARRGGTLVAERGLLTRRTVSLEVDRVRGYVLSAGLGIRLVGAARLTALVTGLGDEARRGQLLPLGPRPVAQAVAVRAVRAFDTPLRAHPSAARRRRLVRAVGPPAVLAVALATSGQLALAAVAVGASVAGVALGLDRFRALGHAADTGAMALREGSILRREVVLERRAVVGWRFRQSYWQRRARLGTVTVCVGAGEGGYDVLDCGVEQGLALIREVSPEWASPLVGRQDSAKLGGGTSGSGTDASA